MSTLKDQFVSNLKLFREIRGLSQEKLAEKVGVSMTFIAHLETGRKSPSFETLDTLGSALSIPPYRLLMPSVPIEESLVNQATEGLREVVKKMFLVVDDVSRKNLE